MLPLPVHEQQAIEQHRELAKRLATLGPQISPASGLTRDYNYARIALNSRKPSPILHVAPE